MLLESVVENLQIITEKLRSPDEETRRQAVVGLREYPYESIQENLFLALGDESWRIRKEAVDIIVAAAGGTNGDSLQELLVHMLRSHDNAGLRNSAVESLERLGQQATAVLCRHVGDADHDVRKFIMDIMGNIADPAFVPGLIGGLEDPDVNVRAAAAENLGKIKDPRAVPPLLDVLAKGDGLLKFTTLEAIGKIGQTIPIATIIPLAKDNLLKKAVFDCLGAVGDQNAIPLLIEGLADKPRKAREAAACALVSLKKRLMKPAVDDLITLRLKELKGTDCVAVLIESFAHADNNLKEALIIILSIIGDERAAKTLILGCCDDRLRKHCLQAFKNMGDAASAALLDAFPSADDDQRCLIAYLCGEMGYHACIPLLTQGMLDENPQLRKSSVQAAGKTRLVVFINEIAFLLEDSDAEIRSAAIEALYRLADKDRDSVARIAGKLASSERAEKRRNAAILCAALSDTEKLSLLIKDEDSSVRKAAVGSLAALKSIACTSHLIMALVDEDPEVRIAAAGALGDMGGDDVLNALSLALKDDDPWVQCAVLKGLGKLRTKAALPAIVELFAHADGLVLITALETLAKIGGQDATALMEKALDNPDEEVVKAAIGILSTTNDDWLRVHHHKLMSHPHWDVRSTFIKAIVSRMGEKAFPYLRQALLTETDELVKGQIIELMDRVL